MLKKNFIHIIIIFVLLLVLTGCEEPAEQNRIIVDPIFRDFYESLGGKPVLGPAISNMYEERGKKLQFTATVLMMYDPYAFEENQYGLVALGNALKVSTPFTDPSTPTEYEIYPGFLSIVRQLGGLKVTGKPICGVKADPENKRIIQYFENVGFYQLDSDPPDAAHLLYYGVWKCAQACNFLSTQENIVIPPAAPGYGIGGAVDQIDPHLSGFPLSDIYDSSDGNEEQIFENVVIYTDPNSPGGIALKSLPQLLGIQPEAPEPAGQEEGKFIAVDGNKGFNVPYHFDEFIELNRGYDFIGNPITKYEQLSDDLFRQCFEKLCLDSHPGKNDRMDIQPMPLGRRYKQEYGIQQSYDDNGDLFNAVTLTVWENHPVIKSEEIQEIYVMVQDSGNPLKDINLIIDITMPDGNQKTLRFPSTGQDGKSNLEIGSIDAPNGTLIGYRVCLENLPDFNECVQDDYLIWGNP